MAHRRSITSLRPFIWFLVVPFLIMSVGYALFSQELQISGTARTVEQDSETDPTAPKLVVTSTRTVYGFGPYIYQFNVTITNVGTIASTGWEVKVDLPATITGISCWNAHCQLAGLQLQLENMSYNGSIPPGGSTSFGIQFTSTSNTITLNDAVVIGDSGIGLDSQYQVMPGLTATMIPGVGWNSGGKYIRQYTILVQNNTGQRLKSWRIHVTNWNNTTHTVESLWGATYVAEPTVLKLTNGNQLVNGGVYSFGGQFGLPGSSWTPVYEVRGRV